MCLLHFRHLLGLLVIQHLGVLWHKLFGRLIRLFWQVSDTTCVFIWLVGWINSELFGTRRGQARNGFFSCPSVVKWINWPLRERRWTVLALKTRLRARSCKPWLCAKRIYCSEAWLESIGRRRLAADRDCPAKCDSWWQLATKRALRWLTTQNARQGVRFFVELLIQVLNEVFIALKTFLDLL
jgi:hypothetical protein